MPGVFGRFGLFTSTALVAGTLVLGALPADAQQRTRLTVYTALDNDQLAPFKQAIESEVKDIEIVWLREGTGIITARVLAEQANPQADLVMGLAVTNVVFLDQKGLIEPYTPKGAEALKPVFQDKKRPMRWTGMDAYISVVCFNRVEAAKQKLPAPETWADLTKPIYRNQVVTSNPASSGAGFANVSSWLQLMGEDKGWAYMDELHKNIAVYTHSGSASCVQAARGERVVGIGFDMRAASEKTKGAPIDIIIPKDGVGWEMEATAIVRGTKNLEAAKRLADWSVTKKANELYGKYFAVVAHPDVKADPPNYPRNAEPSMINNDLEWAARELQRVTAEWTRRYDGKSAPRQ